MQTSHHSRCERSSGESTVSFCERLLRERWAATGLQGFHPTRGPPRCVAQPDRPTSGGGRKRSHPERDGALRPAQPRGRCRPATATWIEAGPLTPYAWSLAALAAATVTVLAAPPMVVALRRWGALDRPNERSSHSSPTPRGGGLAVATGVAVGVSVFAILGHPWPEPVIAGAGGFALIGLVEDLRGVRVLIRLVLQAACAIVVAIWVAEQWRVPAGWLPVVLGTVALWLVAYVNVFNFMDGINGISVAQVVVAASAWVVLGLAEHVGLLTALSAVALGGAVGFAPFNVVHAKVFLGDVGSYGLGALLAGGAVVGLRAGLAPEAVLGPLLPYLADTSTTILRRLRAGETWYQPHRSHAYQRLVGLGWSHLRTAGFVAAIMVLSALLGSVSLAGSAGGRLAADLVLVCLLAGYLAAPGYLRRRTVGLV